MQKLLGAADDLLRRAADARQNEQQAEDERRRHVEQSEPDESAQHGDDAGQHAERLLAVRLLQHEGDLPALEIGDRRLELADEALLQILADRELQRAEKLAERMVERDMIGGERARRAHSCAAAAARADSGDAPAARGTAPRIAARAPAATAICAIECQNRDAGVEREADDGAEVVTSSLIARCTRAWRRSPARGSTRLAASASSRRERRLST